MTNTDDRLTREEQERLGEEIAEISSQIDATMHRLLTCIRRFDEAGGWGDQGALSCAHWLTWRIGLDVGAAREHVRVAKALGGLPKIDEALRVGKLSYSKVRALTRAADSENESTLLEWAETCTGAQLEKVIAKYRRVMRIEGFIPVDDPAFRFLRRRDTPTGMVQVTAQLLPEEAAIVMKALEIARERVSESANVPAETSWSPGRREEDERMESADRVDGLLWLAEAALGGQIGHASAPSAVEVVVHVDQSELDRTDTGPEASLDDGRSIEPESTERLLCDSAIVRVVEDENGTPLDVGRRTRSIPTPIRRALKARDGGCRFPGCTRGRTDGHHVVPWSKGERRPCRTSSPSAAAITASFTSRGGESSSARRERSCSTTRSGRWRPRATFGRLSTTTRSERSARTSPTRASTSMPKRRTQDRWVGLTTAWQWRR